MITITDIQMDPQCTVAMIVAEGKYSRTVPLADLTDLAVERFKEDIEAASALIRKMKDKHCGSNILQMPDRAPRAPIGLG
jgi:hypothetical protein